MSEEYAYIRERLDDVVKGFDRLESKIDSMRDDQVTQRAEINANNQKLETHDKILLYGNGQKSLTVQVAEARTRLYDVEEDIKAVKKGSKLPTKVDSSKERAKLWTAFITVVGLVVSQISMWVFGVAGK